MIEDLLRRADRIEAPDLWPEIDRRRPQRSRGTRRLIAAMVGAAVATVGILIAVRGFIPDGGQHRPAESPVAPLGPVRGRLSARIPVGPFPQEIAVGHGAAWATVNDPQAPESWYVARVDLGTNEVTDRIEVLEAHDVAVDATSVWVTGRDANLGAAVFRIDPESLQVTNAVPLECGPRCNPDQVAVGAGAVWVTATESYPESGYVVRLDPTGLRITGRAEVPGDPRDLVASETGVWVYSLTHFGKHGVEGGSIYRIDPVTVRQQATLLPGEIPPIAGISSPSVLAVGHGYVWTSRVLTESPWKVSVVRIDPATNRVVGEGTPLAEGSGFYPFSVGLGAVWFRGGSVEARSSVMRLDPVTLQIDEAIADVHFLDAALDPTSSTIWATNSEATVMRIDVR